MGKSVSTHKGKLLEKIRSLLRDIDTQIQENEQETSSEIKDSDVPICADDLQNCLQQVEDHLLQTQDQSQAKELKKVRHLRQYQAKLKEYEQKQRILKSRNSYSKTDTNATFMRMKEDHMSNVQLKAGYNVQISTENQFILSYSIHQNASDSSLLQTHLDHTKEQLCHLHQPLPKIQVADAGYGSEQNYVYLEENGLDVYVKYSTHRKEQPKKWRLDPSKVQNLHYNSAQDYYVCPMDQRMSLCSKSKVKSPTGFESLLSVYQV